MIGRLANDYWPLLLWVDYLNGFCAEKALAHARAPADNIERERDRVLKDALDVSRPYPPSWSKPLLFCGNAPEAMPSIEAHLQSLTRREEDGEGKSRKTMLRLALPAYWVTSPTGKPRYVEIAEPRLPPLIDESVDYSSDRTERATWVCLDELHPFAALAQYILTVRGQSDPRWNPASRWVDHDIQEWFRTFFRGRQHGLLSWTHGGIVRPLAEACSRINRLYFDSPDPASGIARPRRVRYVPLSELFRLLVEECFHATEGDPPMDAEEKIVRTRWLLLTVVWARMAELARVAPISTSEPAELDPALTLLRPLDANYVRNCMQAAMSGIDGLRFVFRGGIMPEPDRGRVTVLRGRPGSGKTALALALTADMAARGRTAVYVSLEQTYDWLERQIGWLGLRDDSRFLIAKFDHIQEASEQASRAKRGLLAIAGRLSNLVDPEVNLLDRVDDVIDALDGLRRGRDADPSGLGHPWHAVAIDSVNRFRLGPPDERTLPSDEWYRAQLYRFVEVIEEAKLWGICIAEMIQGDARFDALEFEANAVIELAIDQLHNRTFEIHKSRTQPYMAGVHGLRIRSARGISIVPSLTAMQIELASARRPEMSSQWCLDIRNLGPRPGFYRWHVAPPESDEAPATQRKGAVPTIPVRSSVFLSSSEPKGAFRLGVDLGLCGRRRLRGSWPPRRSPASANDTDVGSEAPWDEGTEAPRAVYVVSFRQHPGRIAQFLKETHYDELLVRIPEDRCRLLWFPPDGRLTAAEVIRKVGAWFPIARDSGFPVDRVVFEGVDALQALLPTVARESGFFPALHETVLAHRVTSIFVASRPLRPGLVQQYEPTVQSLIDLVDFEIVAGRPHSTDGRRDLYVSKSPYWGAGTEG